MANRVIVTCKSNVDIAKEIAKCMKAKLGKLSFSKFPDFESYCKFGEQLSGRHVFIVQSTCCPANENLMELLIAIDAARSSGAKRITAVIPYYGYARQDRQSKPGEPITAALVAKLLKAAGADSIITMDLHSKAVEKAIKVNKTHLHAYPAIASYFKAKKIRNLCIVAPDKGALKNAKLYAKALGAKTAFIEKKRKSATEVEAMSISSNINGLNCLIIDDIISTAGTICESAAMLKKLGAENIYVAATHGVLAGKAIQKLKKAPIKEVVVTNTIPQEQNKRKLKKLKIVSVAKLFCKAIRRESGK
ncbi:MAG: ribose-phosphate pyrophosphokinase [Candidatus Diapherotrites archaeon]|nr:ribose-phosphate pyrophosphokinase [Candidatus Diapherotrites archaeon]